MLSILDFAIVKMKVFAIMHVVSLSQSIPHRLHIYLQTR